jgi:hypothetical protein
VFRDQQAQSLQLAEDLSYGSLAHFKLLRKGHLFETLSGQVHPFGDSFQKGPANVVASRLVNFDSDAPFYDWTGGHL